MNQLNFLDGLTGLKAISLWQPWASLVATGAKRFETRSWYTPYRGALIIHAAKHLEKGDCRKPEIADALVVGGITKYSEIPLGAYLCVVDLVACHRTEQALLSGLIQDSERTFGDYSPNRYAWELVNLRVLPEPIPARGYQALWDPLKDVDPAMKRMIESLYNAPVHSIRSMTDERRNL